VAPTIDSNPAWPGEPLEIARSASEYLDLDVALTHRVGHALPFIGDASGLLGPQLVYEEADPPMPPQYIASIAPVTELNIITPDVLAYVAAVTPVTKLNVITPKIVSLGG